ncbi:hypothetical protein AWQ24_15395 (plasmid) [Picosynechococcus sp. PCC 8807]|nr:hypothetical protein AWQ24_15395 [Picosynechococcus sp. PCC 8807]
MKLNLITLTFSFLKALLIKILAPGNIILDLDFLSIEKTKFSLHLEGIYKVKIKKMKIGKDRG